jgi:phage terminase small subunit
MTLSNKRMAFVEEYLIDFNAYQAALRAGYSERSARQQGSRLLSKDNIQEAIKARLDEKAMSADEVLHRLADMARSDMGDFLDISPMSFQVDLNKAKELGLTKLIKKVKLHTTTTLSKDGVETETHTIETELYDAQAALVQLGRHHKLFTDKTDVNINGDIVVTLQGMDD